MAIVLVALSWVGFFLLFAFGVLCLAAGLFYLAEIVEEYTVLTQKILKYALTCIVGMIVLVGVFSPIGLWPVTVAGLIAHLFYFSLIRKFPYFDIMSPQFILSAIGLVVHHYLTFLHFSDVFYPFDQVVAYFSVCVWAIPFVLFISLSANEYTLPSVSELQSQKGGPKRGGGLLAMLVFLKEKMSAILPEKLRSN
eukprot:m.65737 g.65737  ORF g.65737 m.65737 type:complete len:195 (+) comp11537_c0_seq2:74-658(+)